MATGKIVQSYLRSPQHRVVPLVEGSEVYLCSIISRDRIGIGTTKGRPRFHLNDSRVVKSTALDTCTGKEAPGGKGGPA